MMLTLGSLIRLAASIRQSQNEISMFTSIISLVFTTIAFYYIKLFFDSFSFENPMHKRNIILSILLTIFITILISALYYVQPDIAGLDPNTQNFGQGSTDPEFRRKFIVIGLTSSGLLLMIGIEVFSIFRVIHNRKVNITEERIKRIYLFMEIAVIILIIASILQAPITLQPIERNTSLLALISWLFLISGLGLFAFAFHKGGLFIFKDESLRKLFILDDSGMIYFSYSFRSFQNKETSEDEEILFSGAINAVSSILKEFTGENKNAIEQIKLKNHHMILENIGTTPYSTILIADRHTLFYNEALQKIVKEFALLIPSMQKNQFFNKDLSSKANDIINSHFGL